MIRVQTMTDEERENIRRLAHSRTEATRAVERAKIIWLSSRGERVPAIAKQLGVGADIERVYAIVDNLSVHRAPDVLLFSLAHPRWKLVFQP